MKKTRLLINLLAMAALLCSVFVFASCGGGGDDNDSDKSEPKKLETPVVTLEGDVATWSASDHADKFEISVNGAFSYIESTVTSKKLSGGQTFKIRAIGDGTNYTNSDWSNSVYYTDPTPTYTVVWKNGDEILETDTDVLRGTVPTYDGATPKKSSDAQYSYVFSGWSPEVAMANGDVVYTAVFESVLRTYTVIWKNGKDVLETDKNVEYGTMPSYDGEVPQKAADAESKYVFSGWSPEVDVVVGNVTYIAQFTSAPNTCTVIWKNGDTVLEIDENVALGSTPSYDGEVPTKEATAQYTYTFSGWSPKISSVKESVTYEAQFTEKVRTYKVTFYSEDGATVLDTVIVAYGSTAVYSKSLPVKNATEEHTYVFDKWVTSKGGSMKDDLSNVVADRAVYASFREDVRTVTVYIVPNNADYGTVSVSKLENVPFGSSISYNGNVLVIDGQIITAQEKSSNAQYTYEFVSWNADAAVGNDTIIVANFSRSLNTYTVTWKNGDVVLETDNNVAYGATPVYNGAEPTYSAGEDYVFNGWSPVITSVTGDVTYVATFINRADKYVVVFYNEDGTENLGSFWFERGETAVYPNALPTKESNEQTIYTFDKWVTAPGGNTEANLTNLSSDMSVYAKFSATVRTYTVTFCDWDGTVLVEQKVEHGQSATDIGELEWDGYRFVGWDTSFDNITEDTIVKANRKKVVEIKFVDYDGTEIYSEYIVIESNFENAEKVPSPERVDYRFIGWDVTNYKNVVEDLTVTAQYIRTYRVAFIDYDGTVLKNENVDIGTAASAPEYPTREGYNCVGWSADFDCVTSNLAVYAIYEVNTYTVTFTDPEGNVIATQNVSYGFNAYAPEISDIYMDWRTGKAYRFTGWSESLKSIDSDKIISAVYSEEITDPIVAIKSQKVNTSTDGTTVEMIVQVINCEKPCGISLDIQIDPELLEIGTPEIETKAEQLANGTEYYESRLNSEGRYEFRWTKSNGIGSYTVITFKFTTNLYGTAYYSIDILDSSYIITNSLEKTTPILISGYIAVND